MPTTFNEMINTTERTSVKECCIGVVPVRIQSKQKVEKWETSCQYANGVGVDTLRSESEPVVLNIYRLRRPICDRFYVCYLSDVPPCL